MLPSSNQDKSFALTSAIVCSAIKMSPGIPGGDLMTSHQQQDGGCPGNGNGNGKGNAGRSGLSDWV